MLEVQDVRVDPLARRVWRAEREIVLSRKEYDLLHALISRPGDIVSRDELMRDVWGANFWTSSKTIDVHLGWVRRKLGDDSRRPILISTIRGRGLRFEADAPVAAPRSLTGSRGSAAVRVAPAPTANASGRCTQAKWLERPQQHEHLADDEVDRHELVPGRAAGTLSSHRWNDESAEWLRLSPITKIEPSGTGPAVQSQSTSSGRSTAAPSSSRVALLVERRRR